jgi:hypothetical protein
MSGAGCNVGAPAYVLTIGTYGGIMLSTVFAAERQFRHEAEIQSREIAILGSIRDHREALAAPVKKVRFASRQAGVTWPRPIGVRLDLSEASSAACVPA